jgi:hypothetical protein
MMTAVLVIPMRARASDKENTRPDASRMLLNGK